MHLYFVRHGESEANVANEFSNQNHEKHPLTEKGKQQAQTLAETLCDVKFSAIYSSPMLRARQTAEILNAPHGLEIQFTRALTEHDAGDMEGRADQAAWDEYTKLFERWILGRELDARIPNGESFNDMRARFIPFLSDLTQKYAAMYTSPRTANLLLVGHAGIFHSMLPFVLANVGYAFAHKHILNNAALVRVEQREGALVCVTWDGVGLTPQGSIVE